MNRFKNHDWENCPGAICEADPTPNWKDHVLWYPGEFICSRTPLSHAQKVQKRLNKLLAKGKLKNPYSCYTWKMLNARRAVTPATKGLNPNENIKTGREVTV